MISKVTIGKFDIYYDGKWLKIAGRDYQYNAGLHKVSEIWYLLCGETDEKELFVQIDGDRVILDNIVEVELMMVYLQNILDIKFDFAGDSPRVDNETKPL